MGIQDLQAFFDCNCVQGGTVGVDLLKIARLVAQRQRNRVIKGQQLHNNYKLRLVLDGECCLHRLYGGYYSGKGCTDGDNSTIYGFSITSWFRHRLVLRWTMESHAAVSGCSHTSDGYVALGISCILQRMLWIASASGLGAISVASAS